MIHFYLLFLAGNLIFKINKNKTTKNRQSSPNDCRARDCQFNLSCQE